MAWLEQLETKRSQLLEQVKDQKSRDELQKYTEEISATIGGKYGISSTPATEQERERIIRSIHKTRQIFLSRLNLTSLYLRESMRSKDVLSENSLREIAKRTQTDPELLQNHLAAIAVVDGASFSFRVSDPRDSENIRRNILFTHQYADKDDLNRLLDPIFQPAKKPIVETLIDTLEKIAKTEDAPLKTFLESPFYNSFIAAEAFERLERNDLALEALERAIKHPHASAVDLIRATDRLEGLGGKDLALEALNRVINHPTLRRMI
ncbi:hypothetical protein [Candidatus Finniella inopinata]|uniref:Uncharacterized protein n=1 Tax=Candidatus Finniella inopinata TaxID=1696036 RepID=A0A4Q7DJD8_9PROT|nr:hypothetical protein [Candidatus Finniella inopinata]RZI46144.1 hypothetical protein EQU50_04205 [Candidatus Finniella inopinata]